jgi:hypothetical protein
MQGVWKEQIAQRNLRYAAGWDHLRTIADATELLGSGGLRLNLWARWRAFQRCVVRIKVWHPIWFRVLGLTRPLRSALGLRRATF